MKLKQIARIELTPCPQPNYFCNYSASSTELLNPPNSYMVAFPIVTKHFIVSLLYRPEGWGPQEISEDFECPWGAPAGMVVHLWVYRMEGRARRYLALVAGR